MLQKGIKDTKQMYNTFCNKMYKQLIMKCSALFSIYIPKRGKRGTPEIIT